MNARSCPREAEVLAVLENGRERHVKATSNHLSECESCAEVVTARLIADLHANDLQAANIPSAGQVWWRAQVRARAEARSAAERPMQIVQAVSAACVAGALAAGIGWAWPWIKQAAFWGAVLTEFGFAWWLAIGAWLILAPVALYFVFARE
jgi:hypothetical protein